MQVVQELQQIGYKFTVNNNSLKYQFISNSKPDINKVAVLMAELKKEKQKAIEYLQGAIQDNCISPNISPIYKKQDASLLAKEIINGIKEKALSIGWTLSQLAELQNILPCFIPCQIGLISLKSICIEIFHSDGSIRGALSFYNNEVDQPWLKHLKKGGGL